MQASTSEPEFTVVMLLKTVPERLGFTAARTRELTQEALGPILKKHAAHVTVGYFDVEFYSARVTDIWIWRAKDVHSYHRLLMDLRGSSFWTRYFRVVEVLAGMGEADARNYYRELIPNWADSGFADAKLKWM